MSNEHSGPDGGARSNSLSLRRFTNGATASPNKLAEPVIAGLIPLQEQSGTGAVGAGKNVVHNEVVSVRKTLPRELQPRPG